MPHSIGKTIAELRKAKGWTQIELAEKLQVSDKTISKWEKDGGAPSIEFFPALSEVFGVTIDYLMTGKKVEPKTIIMSKAEFCAKNDDVSMVKDIDLSTKDENGKTLIDYIIEYNSYNVFTAICNEQSFIRIQGANDSKIKKFDTLTLIKFALITNNISILDRSFILNLNCSVDNIKDFLHVEDYLKDSGTEYISIITDEVLDIIVKDKRVNNDTIQYLLSNQKNRECVWYLVLPYLLHQSYLHNNIELFNMVLNASITSNQYAYDQMPIKHDSYYGYNYELRHFMIASKNGYGNKVHGLVRALEKTIKLALERCDIEIVEKLNNLNLAVMAYYKQFKCYIANEDEKRICKLKLDKSVSTNEIKIQQTIHEGIISLAELLAINDYKTIKKGLLENPIHIVEKLFSMYKNGDFKGLLEFASANHDNFLITSITKNNDEYIKKAITSYWSNSKVYDLNINREHLFLYEGDKKISILPSIYNNIKKNNSISIEDIIIKIQAVKQRILNELSLGLDKENIVKELSKEYFKKELLNGNIDIVIIKLCVRLETLLKCDYHYEGTLEELIKSYCNNKLTWQEDDGWGYMTYKSDDKTIKLLHSLRMKRNSIVHAEKTNVELSIEDINYCIDYICNLG